MAADGVAVNGVRMPGKAPTSVHVAVALANPDHEGGEQRQLADVGPDAGPELIPTPGKDVFEIGLEPTRQLLPSLRLTADRERLRSAGVYLLGVGQWTPEPLLTTRQLCAVSLVLLRARTRLSTSLWT